MGAGTRENPIGDEVNHAPASACNARGAQLRRVLGGTSGLNLVVAVSTSYAFVIRRNNGGVTAGLMAYLTVAFLMAQGIAVIEPARPRLQAKDGVTSGKEVFRRIPRFSSGWLLLGTGTNMMYVADDHAFIALACSYCLDWTRIARG